MNTIESNKIDLRAVVLNERSQHYAIVEKKRHVQRRQEKNRTPQMMTGSNIKASYLSIFIKVVFFFFLLLFVLRFFFVYHVSLFNSLMLRKYHAFKMVNKWTYVPNSDDNVKDLCVRFSLHFSCAQWPSVWLLYYYKAKRPCGTLTLQKYATNLHGNVYFLNDFSFDFIYHIGFSMQTFLPAICLGQHVAIQPNLSLSYTNFWPMRSFDKLT